MIPVRIQRKRTKGWRMPPNTEYVGRPHSVFQNRYQIGTHSNWLGRAVATQQEAVDCFAHVIMEPPHMRAYARERLRGKNLACWCALDQPCHADVLLEIANEPQPNDDAPAPERQRELESNSAAVTETGE